MMDAVEYLKAHSKIHELLCKDCPLDRRNNGMGCSCSMLEECYPETAVRIVEDWWKQNKPKTNKEWFKEWLASNGFATENMDRYTCPPNNRYGKCTGISCEECQKWWDEIHEEENK